MITRTPLGTPIGNNVPFGYHLWEGGGFEGEHASRVNDKESDKENEVRVIYGRRRCIDEEEKPRVTN